MPTRLTFWLYENLPGKSLVRVIEDALYNPAKRGPFENWIWEIYSRQIVPYSEFQPFYVAQSIYAASFAVTDFDCPFAQNLRKWVESLPKNS